MYYFLKNKDFDLENYDFDIEYLPRFTKKEKEILLLLLKNHNNQEEYSVLKLSGHGFENIEKTLTSLMKKIIYCNISKKKEKISSLYFQIFEFIILENKEIVYKFSNEILKANKEGNFYSRIHLLGFLKFRHEYTGELFKVILKQLKKEGTLTYPLDDFKKLLKIDALNYERYYNFEQKVLKPIAKDMEEAGVILYFKKIKNSLAKTSRINAIEIHYKNFTISQLHKDTNEIIRKYSNIIEDFAKAYEIIYNYRKFNSMEATLKYIEENKESLK